MRVCMVSDHGCIRVTKEALALISRGITVDVLANQLPFAFDHFETAGVWFHSEQLRRAVKASKADVFHIHNEPDWMVGAVRDATDKPIVYDIHDLESLRWQREPDANERRAFEVADAYVHVSQPCKKAAEKYHPEKPNIVLYPWVNEMFIPPETPVNWGAFCYEGGLSTAPMIDDAEKHTVNFRSLQDIVKAIIEQGYAMYLFPAEAVNNYTYENLGAIVSSPQQYPVLIRAMRAFGFGFVGTALPSDLMDAAMPNKLFEYIASGVVPVIYNAGTAGKWAVENDLGVYLSNFENLPEQLADAGALRANLLTRRREMTMEANIQPLIDLYEAVL